MLDALRRLAGADGALLITCRRDDVALVADASPPAPVAGVLRIPWALIQEGHGLLRTEALPARLLSTAYAHWLPSRVSSSALLYAPDREARGADAVTALLLLWCGSESPEADAQAAARLSALHTVAALLLAPDVARRTSERAAERLSAAMRATPHGIVFVSAHGADAVVNREAGRLLSLPEGNVSAALLSNAMHRVHERLDHRHRVEAEYARLSRDRTAEIRDWEWSFTGAARTVWRVSSVPVSDVPSDGRLWTFEDVSAERAMRGALALHDAREREVTGQQLETVRTLAAGVAHDFSSLLTVISGSVELMEDAPTSTEREHELSIVRQAAKRGQLLVGQLLSFGGQQPSLPTRVVLDDALRDMQEALQSSARELIDARCALQMELDAGNASVVIDERQLSLALLSLIATASTSPNLVDGTPPVLRLRSARRTATPGSGAMPGVSISLVFPAGTQPHAPDATPLHQVAEPQESASNSTTAALLAPFGGTVQHSVQHSQQSSVQQGSEHTATVVLPEALSSGPAALITPRDGTRIPPHEDRLPILVVDDDVGPRRVIRRLLEREGYDVLTASSAEEAMELVTACDGALSAVVSDYLMPGITGMELLARLRNRWPRLPVVLVSGFASELVTDASMHQLKSYFLPKPFTRDELVGALETASLVLRSA